MANLVMVTADLAHMAAVATKAMLESLGHTVTAYTSTAVTLADMRAGDAIVAVRSNNVATESDKVVAVLQEGKPVICGGVNGLLPGDTSANSVAARAGLFTQHTLRGSSETTTYTPTSHPVWQAAGILAFPSTQTVYVSGSLGYQDYATTTDVASGAGVEILALKAESSTDVSVIVAPKGAVMKNASTLAANLIFCSFLYGADGYTDVGKAMIRELLTRALAKPMVIDGTVTDNLGNPLVRKVRCYKRADGRFIAETMSNSAGAFSFTVFENALYMVIAIDEDSGAKNAVIRDRILPVIA